MGGSRCVGIDVSACEITVAIQGRAERTTLANDAAGHAQLVRQLTRGKGVARVCLEATGIYHLDLALALHRAPRVEVAVLNPAAVRDFGRALMQRSKTDHVDADVLLAYADWMPFVAWQPPAPEILDLRAIVRRMGALTLARTQERNRLHAAGHCAELTDAIPWDIEAHLEHLAQSLERLEQQALAIVQSHAELRRRFERLVSVRGIATTSALRILAELAVFPADMTARQWVAHAGLDPRHLESGTSLHKPARISKKATDTCVPPSTCRPSSPLGRSPTSAASISTASHAASSPFRRSSPSSASCSTPFTACGSPTRTSTEASSTSMPLDEEERI